MEYTSSLLQTGVLLAQAGIGVFHCVAPGNPFLDVARNRLVDEFLKTDATDLLFVDADVGWDAKSVTRVLEHPQEVVGGMVPKRDANVSDTNVYHQNAVTGVMGQGAQGAGLFQAMEIPTAFLRIKRTAFDRLKKHGVGTEFVPYFKIGSKAKDFGEDIYFCRRWCETGEFLWVDPDITFTHRGGRVWKGNFFDHCVATGAITQAKVA